MTINNKIADRLQQSVERPSIFKFFQYTIEELQDHPDRLNNIADYLTLHKGKYEDFDIHTWIDPEKFEPVIMVQLYPNEEFRKHINTSRLQKMINYFQENQEK